MFNIKTLNKIAPVGLDCFDKKQYNVGDDVQSPHAILLRSFSMHETELPESLLAVARAGAGVNNIPVEKCSEKGIVVFNTPGANANAVKELTIMALFMASRKVAEGIIWAKTLKGEQDVAKRVEKGKGAFVGPEIEGKRLAVIGLGAIGVMVANTAFHLGMDVTGYDPYISVKSALGLSRHVSFSADLKSVLENADYISIHAPLTPETKNMINEETIGYMKEGARLLNFSRADLVCTKDVKAALENGKIATYITDFPNEEILELPNVVAIPHLGASTPESEDNCAIMASKQLLDFLENGNIANSVNFPNCELPKEGFRVTIAHRNIPNMLSQFSTILAVGGNNIVHMMNKSKKEYAYTIVDLQEKPANHAMETIEGIDGVLSIRIIG